MKQTLSLLKVYYLVLPGNDIFPSAKYYTLLNNEVFYNHRADN